jgi:hypothetical protein
MRNYLLLLLLTGLLGLSPGPTLLAQDNQAANTEAVIERANHLKGLLDKLLTQSNHSSIQKTLTNGSHDNDPLIEEALRLKAEGEDALAEGDHLHAAMALQAALDKVFQAIRSDDENDGEEARLSARLTDAISVNDTFISAATRVVNGEPNGEAVDFLADAREVRERADTSVANGDTEAAVQELAESTQLAQQAIMSVRDGKVIQRGQ